VKVFSIFAGVFDDIRTPAVAFVVIVDTATLSEQYKDAPVFRFWTDTNRYFSVPEDSVTSVGV